jgi:hypothetical protein
MDVPEPAQPPEKRKVGSSTLPLTTLHTSACECSDQVRMLPAVNGTLIRDWAPARQAAPSLIHRQRPVRAHQNLMGQSDLRAIAPSTCQRAARGHRDH